MHPTSREGRLVLEARAQSLISQDLKLKGTMTLRLDALVAANKAVKLEVPSLPSSSLVFLQPHTHPHAHSLESCMTVSKLRERHSKSLLRRVQGRLEPPDKDSPAANLMHHTLCP